MFTADSVLVHDITASPNFGERRGVVSADMLILHYTGMTDTDAALRRLCDPASSVSAHYVVREDGHIVQCVPEAARAWHAGVAWWEDTSDINSRSIGIEIANPGHEHGYPDFPPAQIETVVALCRDIVGRLGIQPRRVLAHSDVAPARKDDPGEKFPWRCLAEAGVGLWVEPARLELEGDVVEPEDTGVLVRELQTQLAAYGYGVAINGHYDEATRIVVRAFQRHFRPAKVDGVADVSTRESLARLIRHAGLNHAACGL